jgi:hypothetical protein
MWCLTALSLALFCAKNIIMKMCKGSANSTVETTTTTRATAELATKDDFVANDWQPNSPLRSFNY